MSGTIVLWHSGAAHLAPSDIGPLLHAGTLEQARMRAGRRLTRIEIRDVAAVRLKDRGENGWSQKALKDAMRRGERLATYLNRYEGIPLEEFAAAEAAPAARRVGGIDRLSDAAFRKAVPSARDSHIVIDPSIVVNTTPCDAEGKPIIGGDATP